MENCKKCTKLETIFNTIGKTYYKLKDEDTILCYRHWHQSRRLEFEEKGEYSQIFSKYTSKHEKQ